MYLVLYRNSSGEMSYVVYKDEDKATGYAVRVKGNVIKLAYSAEEEDKD